jgi:LacI family transcriptional regulator
MSGPQKANTYVSMQDVADDARVSKATVSKVLNNRSDVSRDARKKVLESCEKLGYRLNPNIQDLLRRGVAGHSHDIAFVLSGLRFADPAYAGMIDGISRGVERHNLHLILCNVTGAEKTVYDLPPAIRDRRVAGILISGALNESLIALLRESGIPYVIIGNYPNSISAFSSCVQLDLANLMHVLIDGFHARRRTRIAFFFENPDNHYSRICFEEFKSALATFGIPFVPELVFKGKGGDYGAFHALEPIFQQADADFDAIVCLNYFASIEIACRLITHFGWERACAIFMGTIVPCPRRMLLPTLYFQDVASEIAAIGIDLLVERMKNPDAAIRSVAYTPNLLEADDSPVFLPTDAARKN